MEYGPNRLYERLDECHELKRELERKVAKHSHTSSSTFKKKSLKKLMRYEENSRIVDEEIAKIDTEIDRRSRLLASVPAATVADASAPFEGKIDMSLYPAHHDAVAALVDAKKHS